MATYIKGSINKPLQFIDKLEPGDRIALFYEEPEYARMLVFHYLRIGLISGERCIYLVADRIQAHDQVGEEQNNDEKKKSNKDMMSSNNNNNYELEFIKREMADSEINVDRYLAQGSLYIGICDTNLPLPYQKQASRKLGLEFFKIFLPKSFYSSNVLNSRAKRYRLVLDFKFELNMNPQQISHLQEFEQLYHPIYHSLTGSSICSYPVHNVEETLTDNSEYGQLITSRLKSHTGVIFARKFGKGLALGLE